MEESYQLYTVLSHFYFTNHYLCFGGSRTSGVLEGGQLGNSLTVMTTKAWPALAVPRISTGQEAVVLVFTQWRSVTEIASLLTFAPYLESVDWTR